MLNWKENDNLETTHDDLEKINNNLEIIDDSLEEINDKLEKIGDNLEIPRSLCNATKLIKNSALGPLKGNSVLQQHPRHSICTISHLSCPVLCA